MGSAMTEARIFKLSFFEWTTPEGLFRELKPVFADPTLRFRELATAYRDGAIKSARTPINFYGGVLEEAQVNSPEFCQANRLVLWPDGRITVGDDWPHRQGWAVFFLRADIPRNWPALKRSHGGRPAKETPRLVQEMLKAYRHKENLDALTVAKLAERFSAPEETCRLARIAAKAEHAKKRRRIVGHK
jgi:hypothetical protein